LDQGPQRGSVPIFLSGTLMGGVLSDGRLHFLCLHSYGASAEIMRLQMNAFEPSFEGSLGDFASFTFVDAPFEMMEAPAEIKEAFAEDVCKTPHEWWKGHKVGNFDGTHPHSGLEESLELVKQAWKEQGPFDGIIGFSQGAALAAIIAMGLKSGDERFSDLAPKRTFVLVAFSGWAVKGGPFAQLFKRGPQEKDARPVRAFLSAGRSDRALQRSKDLAKLFEQGSQAAPSSSETKNADLERQGEEEVDGKGSGVKAAEDAASSQGMSIAVFEEHSAGHIIPRPSSALRAFLGSALNSKLE